MTNNGKDESSGWKEFLNFLWDGGFKSLIVLATLVGAILITLNNERVCQGVPTSTAPTPTPTPTRNSTSTPSTATTPPLIQPNPICSKYFDLAFMVVGGYLGLSIPSSVNSNSKTKKNS
jgi:hypothetical protein